MSLESMSDKCALSLGVELHPDGTIDGSSIILTPSLVRVDYRLTYDEVDEMLDEGVGYTEEWEIGALLSAAHRRRGHRVRRGSTEGMVPCPIPKGMVTATRRRRGGKGDEDTGDAGGGSGGEYYDISLKIETTHNSGTNMTVTGTTTITTTTNGGGGACDDDHYDPYCSPVSSSTLIVTEMMILGELSFISCENKKDVKFVLVSNVQYRTKPNETTNSRRGHRQVANASTETKRNCFR